ncbi:MAG: hypothetical protein ACW967_00260 [Candidatus Hodarchaeales archaeon]|jgi:hypothetical protein
MSEKRVIGIRGLDESIYNEIQKHAKDTSKNVSDIFNEALTQYLQTIKEDFTPPNIISGHSKFIINSEALNQLKPLKIENVEKVIIENDEKLTIDLIETNLEGISNSIVVYVPQRLYYIIIKKSKNCENIEPYEGVYRIEETLEFNTSLKITSNMLERFKQQNKRIRIKANGDLWIDFKVDPQLFDEVVSRIRANGGLYCSETLQPIILTKGSVSGNLGIIDENNEPVEVTQVNTKREKRSKKHASHTSPFIDLSGIADAVRELKKTFIDLGPELEENLKKTFENLNFDEEDIKRKKRQKYSPKTKVKLNVDLDEENEENLED